jgi:NAD(P)-dependent dehydrogenase (short-subunit alcohol dehydrogenase family)
MLTHTPQAPLGSGFGFSTTAAEAVAGRRLDGLTAVVTGGHAGIGLATTHALVRSGAAVVVLARDTERARAATTSLPRVSVERVDLGDPASIKSFTDSFTESGPPIDILINNAGIMATPFRRDARGFEIQFATNHLGHFQLTCGLWPALTRADSARVVALSSLGHAAAGIDFDDPFFDHRPYDKWTAYGQSKTANALFAVAVDARGRDHGLRAFSAHPGPVLTALVRDLSAVEVQAGIDAVADLSGGFKTPDQGAATSVWCAASEQLDGMGGVYCEDVDIARAVPAAFDGPSGVRPWATSIEQAEHLWAVSETWTGGGLATAARGGRGVATPSVRTSAAPVT